jgi:glycosyltransferase involved in cell wall biosynthesis
MKLFEYMASKRPIIASRIPSITEIVNDSSAILVEPDNAYVLADAIRSCFNPATSELREKMMTNAFQAVKDNTWKNRAKEIRKFIEKRMRA